MPVRSNTRALMMAALLVAPLALAAGASAQPTNTPVVPPAANPPATTAPATSPSPALPGVAATAAAPNLAVASVRMENAVRVSKVIGAAVYSEQNERIGAVDDLMMADGEKVTMAVVSVGGFLGLGSKLVAIPFDQLKRDADRVVLPGVTKDALNAMPSFVY